MLMPYMFNLEIKLQYLGVYEDMMYIMYQLMFGLQIHNKQEYEMMEYTSTL
uniref:Uncharacterized protein n=1 Tax=Arion vulgaris TaxID=1028688 RepID=A0A0B7AQV9_9EUPU